MLTKELLTAAFVIGLVVVLIKFSGLQTWHAIVLLIVGAVLMLSPVGPQISSLLHWAGGQLSHLLTTLNHLGGH